MKIELTDQSTAREWLDTLSRDQQVEIACRWAESVLHIFEAAYPGDDRPRKAIEAARSDDPAAAFAAYADAAAYVAHGAGTADAAARAAAGTAAYAAARAAAGTTAYAAALAARAAADAAWSAGWSSVSRIATACAMELQHVPPPIITRYLEGDDDALLIAGDWLHP